MSDLICINSEIRTNYLIFSEHTSARGLIAQLSPKTPGQRGAKPRASPAE